MSIKLPDDQNEGLAAAADFTSADTLLTIPSNAKPWGKAVFRHTGTAGYWYGCYGGGTPTTSSYSFKLGPGEPEAMDNPPIGDLNLLASGSGIGALSYSVAWKDA